MPRHKYGLCSMAAWPLTKTYRHGHGQLRALAARFDVIMAARRRCQCASDVALSVCRHDVMRLFHADFENRPAAGGYCCITGRSGRKPSWSTMACHERSSPARAMLAMPMRIGESRWHRRIIDTPRRPSFSASRGMAGTPMPCRHHRRQNAPCR